MSGVILPFPRVVRTRAPGRPFGAVRFARDWVLNRDRQPERILELARAGLSVDAIALLTGWGPLAIRRLIAAGPS